MEDIDTINNNQMNRGETNINTSNKEQMDDVDVVEEENVFSDDCEEQKLSKPFDPTQIDVNIETVNLGSLIDMLENGEIDLKPEFQRASDLWSPAQKSRLIESILLGLPLPSFYFSEDPITKKYAIIDGLQRLCALKDFILEKEKPLHLTKLQFLEKKEGTTYDQLERAEKRRINSLKITMNTLRKDTPNEVKYVIFQRVNTAGIPLTPQEMRHALNQGKPASFIKELAELQSFTEATNASVKTKRMQDRDFANRFVAFYLLGYENYNGELDAFLNSAMEALNKKTDKELSLIKEVFDETMIACKAIFGNDAFRKRNNKKDNRKPISKSVFDTISVNIALLSTEERETLIERKSYLIDSLIDLFNDRKFNFAITVGTGQKYNVEKRFTDIKELTNKVLRHDN